MCSLAVVVGVLCPSLAPPPPWGGARIFYYGSRCQRKRRRLKFERSILFCVGLMTPVLVDATTRCCCCVVPSQMAHRGIPSCATTSALPCSGLRGCPTSKRECGGTCWCSRLTIRPAKRTSVLVPSHLSYKVHHLCWCSTAVDVLDGLLSASILQYMNRCPFLRDRTLLGGTITTSNRPEFPVCDHVVGGPRCCRCTRDSCISLTASPPCAAGLYTVPCVCRAAVTGERESQPSTQTHPFISFVFSSFAGT